MAVRRLDDDGDAGAILAPESLSRRIHTVGTIHGINVILCLRLERGERGRGVTTQCVKMAHSRAMARLGPEAAAAGKQEE